MSRADTEGDPIAPALADLWESLGPAEVLTLSRAAEILGVSMPTAKRLAQAGEFPGLLTHKVGGQYRVSKRVLFDLLTDVVSSDAMAARLATGEG